MALSWLANANGDAIYRAVCGCGGTGRRNGLKPTLSALRETGDVELPKFGETFNGNPEPSLSNQEGVETRRAAPNAATPR